MRIIKDKFPLWFKSKEQGNGDCDYVYYINENLDINLNHKSKKLKESIKKICKTLGELNEK